MALCLSISLAGDMSGVPPGECAVRVARAGESASPFNPLSPSIKLQILLLFPYISYRCSGEKLLKYQYNLTSMIMFSILITSLTDKPLILQ